MPYRIWNLYYYHYFLKRRERFVIRVKKNQNAIYNEKTYNIMDVASQYKGAIVCTIKAAKLFTAK